MNLSQKLKENSIPFSLNIPCKSISTFKIGGNADYLIEPRNINELLTALSLAKQSNTKYILIGCASNVLFSDNGYRGAVIRLKPPFSGMELLPNNRIKVYAGEKLSSLCRFALQNSLSGIEFCYGIPGSVGGAVYMNAGAYGGEITDIFESCEVITDNLSIETRTRQQMDFSYRHSVLCNNNEILVSVILKLTPGKSSEIESRMNELLQRRVDKQPLKEPSAGSTFKRPSNGYASALIDECGLKGYSVGDAMVSTKHAGFVVNNGNASCKEVITLCNEVRSVVYNKKGILLETEVEIVEE